MQIVTSLWLAAIFSSVFFYFLRNLLENYPKLAPVLSVEGIFVIFLFFDVNWAEIFWKFETAFSFAVIINEHGNEKQTKKFF